MPHDVVLVEQLWYMHAHTCTCQIQVNAYTVQLKENDNKRQVFSNVVHQFQAPKTKLNTLDFSSLKSYTHLYGT